MLFFIFAIGIIALALMNVADIKGDIRLEFNEIELRFTPLVAVIFMLIGYGLLWISVKLLRFMGAVFRFFNGDETAISRFLNKNKERQGFEYLTDALIALALGDGKTAQARAERAIHKLNRPELTHLIAAQAAESAGDEKRALSYYKAMYSYDKTKFIAILGGMRQKLQLGEHKKALQLALEAKKLNPNHKETLDTLFNLQIEAQEWQSAIDTIETFRKLGFMPRNIAYRRHAVLRLEVAKSFLNEGDVIKAKDAALHAHKLSPSLTHAAKLAAELLTADNKAKTAVAIIRKTWGHSPHPDLIEAFAEIYPNEDMPARLKRFASLVKINSEHEETKYLKTELAIAEENFPKARRALNPLLEKEPNLKSYSLMAAIERGEGASDETVRAWLNRAIEAPKGNEWVCDNCGMIHSDWGAICLNCKGFDTITWKKPDRVERDISTTPHLGFIGALLTSPNKDDTQESDS